MIFRQPALGATTAEAARASEAAAPASVPWADAMSSRWHQMLGAHAQRDGILSKLSHSLASSTGETYGGHWSRFVRWCESQPDEPCPLPASTETVVRWVEEITQGGQVQESSLQPYLSALNKVHDDLRFEKPACGTFLGAYRKGLARLQVAAQPLREATRTYLPPPTVEAALLWALSVDPRTLDGARQLAFRACVAVVFTFCLFARGGTGSALRDGHVRRHTGGVTVTLAHAKGRGHKRRAQAITIPPGAIPGLEELLSAWESFRGSVPATHCYYRMPLDEGMPPSTAVDSWLGEVLDLLGASPPEGEKWTGHSLRKGAASGASAHGVALFRVCYMGDWASTSAAVHDYIDPTCPNSPACRRFFGWLRPE